MKATGTMLTLRLRTLIAIGIALLTLCSLQMPLMAGELRLTGSSPLTWNPDSQFASPVFTLGIAEEPFESTAEPILAWQAELSIVGTPSSIGTVLFSTINTPTLSERLFGVNSMGLSPSTLASPASHPPYFVDSDASFGGVSIPVEGKKLLDATFEVSANTEGTFLIYAHPFTSSTIGSSWIAGSIFTSISTMPFGGLGLGDESMLLSTITISRSANIAGNSVPEPSSKVLIICVLIFYVLNIFQFRNHIRNVVILAAKSSRP